jgi:hypothetical protein
VLLLHLASSLEQREYPTLQFQVLYDQALVSVDVLVEALFFALALAIELIDVQHHAIELIDVQHHVWARLVAQLLFLVLVLE